MMIKSLCKSRNVNKVVRRIAVAIEYPYQGLPEIPFEMFSPPPPICPICQNYINSSNQSCGLSKVPDDCPVKQFNSKFEKFVEIVKKKKD